MNKHRNRLFLDHLNAHGKPVSRRDFLSLGLIGFAGLSCIPQVTAFPYFETTAPHQPPFLVFDLAGGAALPGNFLVGNQAGAKDYLRSYDTLGWNPRTQKLDERFGLPMANREVSQILQGLLENCSEAAQRNFRFGSLCHQAKSDSHTNPLNGMGLVAQTQPAFMNSTLSTVEQRSLMASAPKIKPRLVSSVEGSEDTVFSTIAMNVINGNSGPGVITIGGCDYHDGTAARGDSKDLEIGQNIGRAIEFAHQQQRPLFLQIITDGGITARKNSRQWKGDCDDRCMTVMGYYNPKEVPQYRYKDKFQVGSYTDDQMVNRSTVIGGSPLLATHAVFANYLQVSGRLSEFEKYSGNIFSPKQLDDILIFQ